jgi:hypothetical protein
LSVSPTFINKESSGESSDAGKWFETTNNDATQTNATRFDSSSSPVRCRRRC